ncbi:aminotransferase class III-fold pyridoxal phosphate-dependent enzyme [Streptomyces sp. NPDC055092]
MCGPVIGAGIHFPTPGHLTAVPDICRCHDILFLDEVTTGFGRTGIWPASEDFGLEPDRLLCTKGLTSGYMPERCDAHTRAPHPSGRTTAALPP